MIELVVNIMQSCKRVIGGGYLGMEHPASLVINWLNVNKRSYLNRIAVSNGMHYNDVLFVIPCSNQVKKILLNQMLLEAFLPHLTYLTTDATKVVNLLMRV